MKRHFLWSISFAVLMAGCSNIAYDRIGMSFAEWEHAVWAPTLIEKDSEGQLWRLHDRIYYFDNGILRKIEALPPPSPAERAMKLQALGMLIQLQQQQQALQQQRQLENQRMIMESLRR